MENNTDIESTQDESQEGSPVVGLVLAGSVVALAMVGTVRIGQIVGQKINWKLAQRKARKAGEVTDEDAPEA